MAARHPIVLTPAARTTPTLWSHMRLCRLRAALSINREADNWVLHSPRAWLGTAFHRLMAEAPAGFQRSGSLWDSCHRGDPYRSIASPSGFALCQSRAVARLLPRPPACDRFGSRERRAPFWTRSGAGSPGGSTPLGGSEQPAHGPLRTACRPAGPVRPQLRSRNTSRPCRTRTGPRPQASLMATGGSSGSTPS